MNKKQTKKKTRYFYISYAYANGVGSMHSVKGDGKFPSLKSIKKTSSETTLVVTNIFEFKSKSDYQDFIRDERE